MGGVGDDINGGKENKIKSKGGGGGDERLGK